MTFDTQQTGSELFSLVWKKFQNVRLRNRTCCGLDNLVQRRQGLQHKLSRSYIHLASLRTSNRGRLVLSGLSPFNVARSFNLSSQSCLVVPARSSMIWVTELLWLKWVRNANKNIDKVLRAGISSFAWTSLASRGQRLRASSIRRWAKGLRCSVATKRTRWVHLVAARSHWNLKPHWNIVSELVSGNLVCLLLHF